ncbi:HNH endonuclease [Demequina sp. TTPB684]|uniref:HNH endonuclease n=1 Tax=unclassified Demequina TaxID=2620311 RepID=UPI001CF2EE69|nr:MULTISPECIES: HNH endonuclease signature motif containing protein [unclassified Demequina]MCB2413661.1 HNH endonuclease [Demequina sp. TTPB684]UPU89750.1 HNH endonuclease [Demequina sp. TMPB413]
MPAARKSQEYLRNHDIVLASRPPCALCGKRMLFKEDFDPSHDRWWLHPMAATVDHIVLVADGGNDALSNLRPAHRSCNSKRNRRHHHVVKPLRERLFGRPRLNALDG